MRLETLELFPEAAETLDKFKDMGVRMALLTNGDSYSQRYKIDKFGLEKYFEIILVEGELGFGKPDKRVYEKAMIELEIAYGDAWMVGDNLEWDVKGAQDVGIHGIWVDFRKQGLPRNSTVIPDRIVYDISELLN
jgi:putative hydrolase of the HAD superfamily